jgi:exodeoxyribonuclease V beta subunit
MNMAETPEDVLKKFQLGQHWLIEANAGSGKTYTLENIVAHLISNGMLRADEILLVTFTVKAATELRARVRERLQKSFSDERNGDSAKRDAIAKALALPDALWNIQTIHGFCQNALLEFPLLSGTAPHFQLVDEAEIVLQVINKAMRCSWLKGESSAIYHALNEARLCGQELSKLAQVIAEVWSSGARTALPDGTLPKGARARFDGITHDDDPKYIEVAHTLVREALNLLPQEIERFRTEHGLMTFNSLIADLRAKVDSDTPSSKLLLDSLRKKFRICIVDEFQDTDELQWEIFHKIFCESKNHSFICVGDPKQSIYSFRGADIASYNNAKKWLTTHNAYITNLGGNWRSSIAMVSAVNELLTSGDFESLNYQNNISTSMRPTAGIWEDREMTRPLPPIRVFRTEEKKGKVKLNTPYAIAREIHRIMKNPPWICIGDDMQPRQLGLSDMMILTAGRQGINNGVASGDQSDVVAALNHFQIPYWVYRHEKLFLMPEVQTLLDVFLAALQPEDDKLKNRARLAPLISGRSAYIWMPPSGSAAQETSAFQSASNFINELGILLQSRKYNSLMTLCRARLQQSPHLEEHVRGNIEVALEQLFEVALMENLNEWQTLAQLREWILSGDGAEEQSTDSETSTRNIQGQRDAGNAVTLVTWHSAKGGEAPVTFVTGGFYEYQPNELHEFRLRFLRHAETQELRAGFGKAYALAAQDKTPYNKDEHQRLQYVVLTRACVQLFAPLCEATSSLNEAGKWMASNNALKQYVDKRGESIVIETFPLVDWQPLPASDKVTTPPEHMKKTPIFVAEPLQEGETPNSNGVIMSSYSSLKKRLGGGLAKPAPSVSQEDEQNIPPEIEVTAEDDDAIDLHADTDLLSHIGGKEFGVFVHSLFEQINWQQMKEGPSSSPFKNELNRVIEESSNEISMRFGNDAIVGIGTALFNALTTPLFYKDVVNLPEGIWQADDILCEVDFHLPEVFGNSAYPDRQFYKGYIDLVFRHNGRTFFLDWKTDRLEEQEYQTQQAFERVIRERGYELQLHLYSRAVFHALGGLANPQRAYEEFGGGVYLFIRFSERGVYVSRPTLSELTSPMVLEPSRTRRSDIEPVGHFAHAQRLSGGAQ